MGCVNYWSLENGPISSLILLLPLPLFLLFSSSSSSSSSSFSAQRPYAALVGRTMEMIQLQISAPEHYFNGTVIDAEIIPRSDRFILILFDLIMLAGKRCMTDFLSRYKLLHSLFLTPRADSRHLPVEIYFKPFYRWSYFPSLIRKPSTIPSDGFIFMPVQPQPMCFRQKNLYKWKPTHTVDLLVKVDGSLFWNGGSGTLTPVDFRFRLEITTISISENLIAEFSLSEGGEGEGEKETILLLRFLKIRTDKTTPNYKETVLDVIRAVRSPISLDQLINLKTTETEKEEKEMQPMQPKPTDGHR